MLSAYSSEISLSRPALTSRPARRRPAGDEVLNETRTGIDRVYAFQLPEALARGAVVVDIRSQAQRAIEGTLPGALAIERNLLEWRLDPASDARLSIAADHDVEWIIVCSDGHTASRAATALQQRGLSRATALVGGYRAIKAAGLVHALSGARHCVREAATIT